MKILVAIDHSEASEAVLKEVAARPWPPRILHRSPECGGAGSSVDGLADRRRGRPGVHRSGGSRRRRASRLGSGSGRRIAQGRRETRDSGPGQGNEGGFRVRRLAGCFGAGALSSWECRVGGGEPRSVFGRDCSGPGRQAAGCSQDTAGDGWIRVFGARREIDRGSALARGDRDRSPERGGAGYGNRAGLVRAALCRSRTVGVASGKTP